MLQLTPPMKNHRILIPALGLGAACPTLADDVFTVMKVAQ